MFVIFIFIFIFFRFLSPVIFKPICIQSSRILSLFTKPNMEML